uniref:Putative NAC domain-containing protein 78 n=1 Tax=Davidia involucrata TaxID=16924 RepID=A0A5B6YG25_DAVIN
MIPGKEAAEELVVGDEDYLNGNDLEQILDARVPSEDAPLPLNFYYGDNSNYVEESMYVNDDVQNHLVGMGENQCDLEHPDGHQLFDLPLQNDVVARTVKHEYIGESSNPVNPEDADYLLDEPFLDATENPPFDEAFLETNDLSKPIEADPSGFDMLEEYLTFFDADDDTSQYMAFDSSKMMGSENLLSDQASLTQKHVNGDTHQEAMASQQLLEGHNNDVASSSKQESAEFKPDIQYPFINSASRMLNSIPAPPAFASEFPAKDAALRLSSASQSSNSVHVTTGMIQIRNVTLSGNGTDWLFGKHGYINITLSFDLSRSNSASLEPMPVLSSKAGSAMSRGWLYLMFIWVLILSISYKIGSYIYTGNAAK